MGGWLLRVLFERGGGRLWGFSCFWEGARGGGVVLVVGEA